MESMMDYAINGGFKHTIGDPKRFPLQLSNVGFFYCNSAPTDSVPGHC